VRPEEALARLGVFSRGARVIRTLRASPVKHSYLIERRGERYVLRVDGPMAERLGLDRRTELQVLRVVAAEKLGPEPVAWRLRPPAVLLTRYVPGRSWSDAELRAPSRLRQLAEVLKRIHRLSPEVPALNFPARLDHYAKQAALPEARALVAEALELIRRLKPRRDVLCHHDPIAANVIGRRPPLLIDWEYAALGDPMFDIALIARHHALSEAQTRVFLQAYFGHTTMKLQQRIASFAALYDRVTLLWLLAMGHNNQRAARQRALLAQTQK
jgi:thiamine kinase